MLKNVHSSFIRKREKLEIDLALINGRMDKQINILQQGLQLSNKKGLITNKHNYMNKFQKRYLKGQQPDTKHTCIQCYLSKILEQPKLFCGENRAEHCDLGVGGMGCILAEGERERVFCAGDGILSLDRGLHYTDTNICQNLSNVHSKCVHLIQNETRHM